jgi:(2Fe-2S) ferredoxin
VPAYSHHVFVCGNLRSPGHPRGCCDPEGADRLRTELKRFVKQRGLGGSVRVNKAGCLDHCEHGPVVVIYPHSIWYGGVTAEDLPRIVDETLLAGHVLDDLLIRDECLCNSNCEHVREFARVRAAAETSAQSANDS